MTNKGQFVNVKDLKDGKLHRAKVVKINEERQAVKGTEPVKFEQIFQNCFFT